MLPAGAQNGITLELYATQNQLRGRYSLDDGTTWTEVGSGFSLSGLAAPGIGVAAYNGTGAEVASFESFTVGEPPEVEPPAPCGDPDEPEAGYSMLFDGTDESLEDWKYAGGGSFVREDCTIKSTGGFGLLYTAQEFEAPYSLKLEWMMPGDDNSGVFVGFSDTGATTDQTSISQGEEIQIDATDDPDSTTGAIYNEQAADAAARDAALNPPGEWNAYELVVLEDRIIVYLNGTKINEWIDDDPNVDLATGHIGLQTHGAGDDVYFRNVQIRDLDEPVLRESTTTATADPAQVTVGRGSNVTVTVAAAGAAPTGEVRLKAGDTVLGTGTLQDGEVTIPTGAFGSAGTKALTAEYAGDATTRPSSGSVEIRVRAANPGGGNPGGGNPGGGNPGGGNPGGGNPGGGNPPARPSALVIRGGKADADRERRKAAIRVRCTRGAGACAGTVRLRVGERTVGTGRFRIAAGTTRTIRVALTRRARTLLAQRKRANATLTIRYRDGRTQRVRLRLTR